MVQGRIDQSLIGMKAPTVGTIKRAWIRDPKAAIGVPSLGKIACPCGNAPHTAYSETTKPFICSCGRVYTWNGYILGDTPPREREYTTPSGMGGIWTVQIIERCTHNPALVVVKTTNPQYQQLTFSRFYKELRHTEQNIRDGIEWL